MRTANSSGVRQLTRVVGVAVALWIAPAFVIADEPLHQQIDALIAARFQGRTSAPLADDAEPRIPGGCANCSTCS
ncbi:MAG: hypothetical protein NT069_12285 [Planctomycetota bacterium]|nr:hypothetical protein [Planctomycetota bacterium]